MCRMFALLATHPTHAGCDLVAAPRALKAQCANDHKGECHADGWGIATRAEHTARLERSTANAALDPEFAAAAVRAEGTLVLAHVRQASVGTVRLENTHPFQFGTWQFAHNGTVAQFADVSPRLEREIAPDLLALRQGSTDSELIFLWLLSRVHRERIAPESGHAALESLGRLLLAARRELVEWSPAAPGGKPTALNWILTNGRLLVVSRWGRTLFWRADDGPCSCETCGRPHTAHTGSDYRAVRVASEATTASGAWHEFPEGAALVVGADARPKFLSDA